MTQEQNIINAAGDIMKRSGYVTTRDVYAALPETASMRRRGKKEPSLAHISRVLQKNGYRPVGNTRGGYTRYVKQIQPCDQK